MLPSQSRLFATLWACGNEGLTHVLGNGGVFFFNLVECSNRFEMSAFLVCLVDYFEILVNRWNNPRSAVVHPLTEKLLSLKVGVNKIFVFLGQTVSNGLMLDVEGIYVFGEFNPALGRGSVWGQFSSYSTKKYGSLSVPW